MEKIDMLEKIYEVRQIDFEEENRKDREILSKMSNAITFEKIEEDIKALVKENKKQGEQIINELEELIENYEIQVAYYSQKNYKRGFKDAIQLYNQSLREE